MRKFWFVIFNLSWGLIHNLRYQHHQFSKNGVGAFWVCKPRVKLLGNQVQVFSPDLPDNVTYNVPYSVMYKIITTARTGVDAARIINDVIETDNQNGYCRD